MGIIKTVVKKCFGKYLLVTNTVSSGILMAVGDSMQQQIETYRGFHENESHDAVRSSKSFPYLLKCKKFTKNFKVNQFSPNQLKMSGV